MRSKSLFTLAVALLVMVPAAFGQGNPTGTISGRLTDPDGLPLAGATVTAESPQLQGQRTTTASANGDYILALLPPGDYTITISLSGFQTVRRPVRVAAAQATPVDVTLGLAAVAEEVTVTATAEEFQQTAPVASSYKSDLIDKLAVGRTLNAAALLAPGVQNSGPQGGISISGSASFENLFLINGVVVNENVRGQANTLFIEDAIQETTTITGAISAEFGRFGGGVVNSITKSGGNAFSGSLRTTFNNDTWRGLTRLEKETCDNAGSPAFRPGTPCRTDRVIPIYEATLGGPILKDKIWFFGAARMEENERTELLRVTNTPFDVIRDQKRYEGKLTFSPSAGHMLRTSYIRISDAEDGNFFAGAMDRNSLVNRTTPQDLLSLNYTGTIGSKLFVEAQYSRRGFTFEGSGSQFTDPIRGTLLLDRARGNTRYWSPTFCGVCDDEKRDNRNILLKAGYFLSTKMGSHNIVAGFDSFDDRRFANNHQSGSDYRVFGTTSIIRGDDIFPVFNNDASTFIRWTPIFEDSQGTNFRTHAGFINDTWRLNGHWTFNLGLRYDRNDGEDSSGNKVVKDDNWSPRVAATFDPTGTGAWSLSASYAKYVAAIANGIGDGAATGGQPATIDFDYLGPAVNVGNPANPVPADQALQVLFGWFNANGGTARPTRGAPTIPGVNTSIGDRLRSPNVNEYTLSVSRKLGRRGLARIDGVWREFRDFYSTRVDPGTGTVTDARLADFGLRPAGRTFDRQVTENTNDVERKYRGLSAQLSYRPVDRLNLGGNYTLSRTEGNVNGETGPGGPSAALPDFYPEYHDPSWNRPVGDLLSDRRHKLSLWGIWDLPLPGSMGSASFSLFQAFNSGTPYGAQAVNLVDTRPFVTNPGYAAPDNAVDYFFTARDAFRTDDEWRTDITLNYAFRIKGLGSRTELFFKGEIINVFDNDALSNFTAGPLGLSGGCGTGGCINVSVQTNNNNNTLQRFNPFTQQPVEGVHWRLAPPAANGVPGSGFGEPLSRFAYQHPRLYRFAVGFRF